MLTKIMHAHVWKIFNSNYLNIQIIIWRKIHYYLGLQYRLYTGCWKLTVASSSINLCWKGNKIMAVTLHFNYSKWGKRKCIICVHLILLCNAVFLMSWRFQREAEKSNYFWNIYKYVELLVFWRKKQNYIIFSSN